MKLKTIFLVGIVIVFCSSYCVAADAWFFGNPESGNVVSIEFYRANSNTLEGLMSLSLEQNPINYPTLGTLYLHRRTMEFLPHEVRHNWINGNTTFDFFVDPLKYSNGDKIYFQGLGVDNYGTPLALTNDYTFITVGGENSRIPSAPINVDASDGEEQITISWDMPSGAVIPDKYFVYRSFDANILENGILIGETVGQEQFFTDTEMTMGTGAFYAVVSKGNKEFTNVDSGSVNRIKGLRWSHYDWFFGILMSLSIGNNGAYVATSDYLGSSSHRTYLFSLMDINPPTPIYLYGTHPYDDYGSTYSFHTYVESAKNADAFADTMVTVFNISGGFEKGHNNFRRYSSTNPNPINEGVAGEISRLFVNGHGTDNSGVFISDDGSKMIQFASSSYPAGSVGLMNISTYSLSDSGDVLLYSAQVYDYIITSMSSWTFSGDGSKLVVAGPIVGPSWDSKRVLVIDTATGNIEYNAAVCDTGYGYYSLVLDVASNYDGSRVAVSCYAAASSYYGQAIEIIDNPSNPTQYDVFVDFDYEGDIPFFWGKPALSDDGNTLAYAYGHGMYEINNRYGGAFMWDISNPSNPVTLTEHHFSNDPELVHEYYLMPHDVAITSDGNRFVAGFTGDGDVAFPNLLVFEKGQDNPIASFYTPLTKRLIGGTHNEAKATSVLSVDITSDGKKVVAIVADSHSGTGISETYLNTYDIP
ncbi:MAG: hypothetical protein ABIF88_04195 [archaeon]